MADQPEQEDQEITISHLKFLKSNALVVVFSKQGYKDQIFMLQPKRIDDQTIKISRSKKIDLNINKVKGLTVIEHYQGQTQNMLYLMIVDETGKIISLQITAQTFRIQLPGYEVPSHIDLEPIRAEVSPFGRYGLTYFASVLTYYEDRTQLALIELKDFSQFYSKTFDKEISQFSAVTLVDFFSMVVVQFKDGTSETIGAEALEDGSFNIQTSDSFLNETEGLQCVINHINIYCLTPGLIEASELKVGYLDKCTFSWNPVETDGSSIATH